MISALMSPILFQGAGRKVKITDSASTAVFYYLKNLFSVAIAEENTLFPSIK
jgi:hypothetical protein